MAISRTTFPRPDGGKDKVMQVVHDDATTMTVIENETTGGATIHTVNGPHGTSFNLSQLEALELMLFLSEVTA